MTTGEHPYPNYVFTFLRPNQRIVDREYATDTLLVADYDGVSYSNPQYVDYESYKHIFVNTSSAEYKRIQDHIIYAVQHVWYYNKLTALDLHKQSESQLPDDLKDTSPCWQGLTQINKAIIW